MQLNIAGRYLKAASTIASKEIMSPVLCAVHLQFNADGLWRIEATDSYRLFRVETRKPYKPGADDVNIIIPADTFKQLKLTDSVSIEVLDAKLGRYEIKRTPRNSDQTISCEPKLREGKYPNMDALIPTLTIPRVCYRTAVGVNPEYLESLLKASRMCVNDYVELATREYDLKAEKIEGKSLLMYGFAHDEEARVTIAVMPVRVKDSIFGEVRTSSIADLQKQNRDLKAELKFAKEQWHKEAHKAKRDKKDEGQTDENMKLKEQLNKMSMLVESITAEAKSFDREAEKWKREAEEWKHKAEEAANASAKAAASDMAEATSLEEIAKWCESHTGTRARRKGNGPVWVTGNTKPCKDELAGMGFKYGFHKEFGKGWWKK